MTKKGEMSSSQIVTTILIVTGFAIVAFLYWQIAWSGRVDKETCHESVIFRGALSEASESAAQAYVPLKCQTTKTCITAGLLGGKCSDFENLKGIEKTKVKTAEQVERVIAQNIIDCWEMMGEGRVKLFSQKWAETYGVGSAVYPSCVICSRIAFDMNSLQKAGITKEELAKIDISNYMMTHLVPGKDITYYEFLVGNAPAKINIKDNLLGLQKEIDAAKAEQTTTGTQVGQTTTPAQTVETQQGDIMDAQKTIAPELADLDKSNDVNLQDKELAVLFMQISSPTHGGAIGNVGKTAFNAAVGSFSTAPKASYSGVKQVVKLCQIGPPWGYIVCGAILVLAGIYQQGSVAYNRAITAGYCGDVSTGTDARNGCSVVRTVSYDIDEIKQYCAVIESVT